MPPTPAPRDIVILDHEPAALHWIAARLLARGHRVAIHRDAPDAAAGPDLPTPGRAADLVVAYRPGWSEACRAWLSHLHDACGLACVVVTGPDTPPEHRVAFLEAGADDCLHLGLPQTEIQARVLAALRRAARSLPPGPARHAVPAAAAIDRPAGSGATLLAGGWRLVPEQRSLLPLDGRPALRLTSAEFEFLRVLSGAAGAPVDRDAISRAVFRRPWRVEDRAVDSLVKRLRQKIGDDPIASVRGVGYALLTAAASPSAVPAGRSVA